jgi:hypothetical protein
VVLQADLHQADRILDDPAVRALVDFDRPVCLLLVAMLHFIPDLVHLPLWRPDPGDPTVEHPDACAALAAVGVRT